MKPCSLIGRVDSQDVHRVLGHGTWQAEGQAIEGTFREFVESDDLFSLMILLLI